MKAAVIDRYGPPDVVRIRDIPTPEPGPGQVQIRVVCATVSSGDARVRGFNLPRPIFWLPGRLGLGLFGPRQKVLGMELSGVVSGVGEGASRFTLGERVIAHVGIGKGTGAHAEYFVRGENEEIERVPAGLPMDQAACIGFGGMTAVYFLEHLGKLRPGQRVMVVGASGSVGLAAVAIAKHLGGYVTGVCSGPNAELVGSVGADCVIDYQTQDYTDPEIAGGDFDLVFDAVGATRCRRCRRIIKKDGLFLACVMGFDEIARMLTGTLLGRPRVRSGVSFGSPERLVRLCEIVESGGYRPVVDRTYSLDEIADAYRYVDTWRKKGNVVIDVSPE